MTNYTQINSINFNSNSNNSINYFSILNNEVVNVTIIDLFTIKK